MAEDEPHAVVDSDDENFQAPASSTIDDMINAGKEDKSLQTYMEILLGDAAAGSGKVVVDESDPRILIVKKLSLVVDGRPDVSMDLTEDLDIIKTKKFTLKEGSKFRIRIEFLVQREIVTGLKYIQKTIKGPMTVDKLKHMVGSYAPKMEPYTTLTESMDAPSGMLLRGEYKVSSLFTDDDKHEHLKWEWAIEIKKDWDV
jgi:Rho GDP-dissociation inhibitor